MKLLLALVILFVEVTSGTELLGECETDCDLDSDCAPGLLCADAHKAELAAVGCDQRKAYCGSDVGGTTDEVCYNPATTECSTPPDEEPEGKLDECEADCDSDSDCKDPFLCADDHKAKLMEAGYDERKAYCSGDGQLPTDEVCFHPAIFDEQLCKEDFLAMSDDDIFQYALDGGYGGPKIGDCYIQGPPGGACQYYVKGGKTWVYGTKIHIGVPEGTGCIVGLGSYWSGGVCWWNNPTYVPLTSEEKAGMCTYDKISNGAYMLRFGIENDYCNLQC